jgi:hypothetical protein
MSHQHSTAFSISINNVIGILMGIALNLLIGFSSRAISTMQILLIPEGERSLYLLLSFEISFFRVLVSL